MGSGADTAELSVASGTTPSKGAVGLVEHLRSIQSIVGGVDSADERLSGLLDGLG